MLLDLGKAADAGHSGIGNPVIHCLPDDEAAAGEACDENPHPEDPLGDPRRRDPVGKAVDWGLLAVGPDINRDWFNSLILDCLRRNFLCVIQESPHSSKSEKNFFLYV